MSSPARRCNATLTAVTSRPRPRPEHRNDPWTRHHVLVSFSTFGFSGLTSLLHPDSGIRERALHEMERRPSQRPVLQPTSRGKEVLLTHALLSFPACTALVWWLVSSPFPSFLLICSPADLVIVHVPPHPTSSPATAIVNAAHRIARFAYPQSDTALAST